MLEDAFVTYITLTDCMHCRHGFISDIYMEVGMVFLRAVFGPFPILVAHLASQKIVSTL